MNSSTPVTGSIFAWPAMGVRQLPSNVSYNKCEAIVITLSEDGVGLFNQGNCSIFPTNAKDVYDVTGAGDTFIATLAYAISIGKSLSKSCEIANYASGIVVGKQGCMPIEFEEIKSFL